MRLLILCFKLIRKLFLLLFVICLVEFAIIMLPFAKGNILQMNGRSSVFPTSGEKSSQYVAKQIVDACPQPERSYSRLLILPVVNDRNNVLGNQIRKSVQHKIDMGWYVPVEKTIQTNVLETIQGLSTTNDEESSIIPKKNAIRLGQLSKAEFVLCGTVDTFAPSEKSHDIYCRFYLIKVKNGDVVFESTFSNQPENVGMVTEANRNRLISRGCLVGLVMFACPLVLAPGFRPLTRIGSRFLCFAGVLAISVIPMYLAIQILEIPLPIFMQITCYVTVFVLTAFWTAFLMDRAAENVNTATL